MASILANEFVNAVQLNARPPIVYDGNDPDFTANGGPIICPGGKSSSKMGGSFQQLKIGDPKIAMDGVQFLFEMMKVSLGNPGNPTPLNDRASATEVLTKQADSESGPFNFASKMDTAIASFLYMQHSLNLANKKLKYSFFCNEMGVPSFIRIQNSQLPENVHFEITGTKTILGIESRKKAFAQVTVAVMGNEKTAGLLDPEACVKQMYQDAGIRAPERFLKPKDADALPPEIEQLMQQAQQHIEQQGAELKTLKESHDIKAKKVEYDHQAKMASIQMKHANEVSRLHIEADRINSQHQMALGTQAQQLKSNELDSKIAEIKHVLAETVLKHTLKEKQEGKGDMGVPEPQ
jgi:hypothetical protein